MKYGEVKTILGWRKGRGDISLHYAREPHGRSVWLEWDDYGGYPERCTEGGSISDAVARAIRDEEFEDSPEFMAGMLVGLLEATPEPESSKEF